jgi:hypothetical protein
MCLEIDVTVFHHKAGKNGKNLTMLIGSMPSILCNTWGPYKMQWDMSGNPACMNPPREGATLCG